MNLDNFTLEELLLIAIKSEVESRDFYLNIVDKTKNGLLIDKLKFIANEEKKHKLFIEDIYMNHFPGKKIILPDKNLVPLPKLTVTEDTALGKLLKDAMEAEQASSDFYKSLADYFEDGSKIQNTLIYFSDMEKGHYKILETEKESMDRFEESDVYWPMIHAGP